MSKIKMLDEKYFMKPTEWALLKQELETRYQEYVIPVSVEQLGEMGTWAGCSLNNSFGGVVKDFLIEHQVYTAVVKLYINSPNQVRALVIKLDRKHHDEFMRLVIQNEGDISEDDNDKYYLPVDGWYRFFCH